MISANNITFSYDSAPVLQNVSIQVEKEAFTAIIGPNGAGKSTLLKMLAGVLSFSDGSIELLGKNLVAYKRRELAKIIAYVAQHFESAFDFRVYDIVAMGRFPHQQMGKESATDRKIIQRVMAETDIWRFRERGVMELSGGERQRVVLASALAQEPQILLLDEPTTALDLKHQIEFYTILQRLNQSQRLTIVTVTHDINLAARYCKRLVAMKNGRLVAEGLPENMLNAALIEQIYETPIAISVHPFDGTPLVLPR